MEIDRAAVADGDPGALLPAMLQSVEPKIDQPGDIIPGRIHPGKPARFVQDVTGRLCRFLVIRPGHICCTSRTGTKRPGFAAHDLD
jgi:hypothetical protein